MNLNGLRRWLFPGRRRLEPELCRGVDGFEAKSGYRFRDTELICGALTHRSYLNSNGTDLPGSNERLEFLGDAVLELVVNHFLFNRYADQQEGELTKMKSLLVSRNVLAEQARCLGLGEFVFLSDAERDSGGENRASILADAFEAVIGAIYLDGGLGPARRFISENLLKSSEAILIQPDHANYKSILQEHVQEKLRTYPRYLTLQETGPDHAKVFTVEVVVKKDRLGLGKGTTKKRAEQAAAHDALETLGISI
jgi:ribonuclease-3